MSAIASTELLTHLRRLLDLAGTDQHAAQTGFDTLAQCYHPTELATAIATVTAEFVASPR